mmetsp:Transcript_26778/g.75117  ORF Transcript_26778/g.75117 Transcript_26778/m.75117 type:complete len:475 (-) Transcript_26778:152-1576(-)
MKMQFHPNVLNAAILAHLVSTVTSSEVNDIVNRFQMVHGEPIDHRLVRRLSPSKEEEEKEEDAVPQNEEGVAIRRRAKKGKAANTPTAACDNLASLTPARLFEVLISDFDLATTQALDVVFAVSDLSKTSTVNQIGRLLTDEELCFTGTESEVSEMCGYDCCYGEDACGWEGDATVCVGACRGYKSCYAIEEGATIYPFSCVGYQACYFIGRDEDPENEVATAIFIGAKSCVGEESCDAMGYKEAKKITVGYASCVGAGACYYLGDDVKEFISIGDFACDGLGLKTACSYMDAKTSITIGDISCVGDDACKQLGEDGPDSISIGRYSCYGGKACQFLGTDLTAGDVAIKDKACFGEESCYKIATNTLSANILIGSYACDGFETCENIGALSSDGPSLVSIGDNACVGAQNCFGFGFFVSGEISVAANACSFISDDVVCTPANGGNDACDGNGCIDGKSFNMPEDELPCDDICSA